MPHPHHPRSHLQSFAFCVLCFAFSTPLPAQTHILTFGGGPSPDYNQISLEKNVLFFQHTLADLHLNKLPHDIFFADGGTPYHTVKFLAPIDPSDPSQNFNSDLAYIANQNSSIDDRYEPVSLQHLNGPSTHAAMENWFASAAKSLHPGDHLLFYFTGHGGDDTSRAGTPRNTTMEMWDSPPFTVRQFLQQLDKLDPSVDITLIMVQCHSGGFANVLYIDGDFKKGFAKNPRCGFFSTAAPRLAAGCTPEMNEDAYQDFSTHFFAALSGKTRTGKPVPKPDYDKKGATSFTDAFTYALLNDDTIDIPLMTSDQFLRDLSHYRTRDETTDILENLAKYPAILAVATPAQAAALDGLSSQLSLAGDDRLDKARTLARDLQSQRNALAKSRRPIDNDFNNARNRLHESLLHHYPELAIPNHPDTAAILAKQHDALRSFLESQPDYKTYQDASRKRDNIDDQDDQLERRWVTTQRLLERARTVILAANLPKVAKPDILAAYSNLIARENQTLSP